MSIARDDKIAEFKQWAASKQAFVDMLNEAIRAMETDDVHAGLRVTAEMIKLLDARDKLDRS